MKHPSAPHLSDHLTVRHAGSLMAALLILVFSSCLQDQPKMGFASWYENTYPQLTRFSDSLPPSKTLHLQSDALLIDTIYRSMQGPYDVKEIQPEQDEDLIWLTGYQASIINAKDGNEASSGLMCHNNLDITDKSDLPWIVRTQGTSIRLFTLSEGQTTVQFPPGFGIPLPADQTLSMFSQVLNHNVPDVNIYVKHMVDVHYIPQSSVHGKMKPLYSQVVFVTKQTSSAQHGNAAHCGINIDSSAVYDPYHDAKGNTYTGHWRIPVGTEVLQTNVTQMLDLSFDTRIHYIGVHLHPFASSLSLKDVTADTILFSAAVVNFSDKIGLDHIPAYSSAEGIAVYKDHEYELISIYNCTDSINEHTAMATMLLYLEEK